MTQATTFSPQFLTELQRLHQERRTGLLMITKSKLMVQLNLLDGEIVYLACSDKRGNQALELLPQVDSGKLRFVDGPIPALRTPLPATSDILNYLGAVDSTSPVPESDQHLSASRLTALQQELAEFIGPIATFICEEQLVGVHDVETALAALSQVLPNLTQADRFKENVRRRLGLAAAA